MILDSQYLLRKCRPTKEDARLIMDWRNDPLTLSMFYHQEPKVWESFWPEYKDNYFRYSSFLPLFLLFNQKPVSFLRYLPVKHPVTDSNATVSVSMNVSPDMRRKGIGKKTLDHGSFYLKSDNVIKHILAEIRTNNEGSIRTFTKAGYIYLDNIEKIIDDTGEIFQVYRYVKDL